MPRWLTETAITRRGSSRLEKISANLLENARLNLDEHEKIWSAVNTLRVSHVDLIGQIANLTSAIRDLIGRIPPENLR